MVDRVVKYVFRGDISGLKSSLTAAGTGVRDLGNKLTASGKDSDKFRRNLSTVGDAAGKIGLGAAAGLAAIVVTTAKFDKAMSGVQAATHASASSMETLRAAAIKAGAQTAFSASEAADGIEQLAKAGVSTKDILGGGLSGALDLAAAGSMSVGDAAEVAATAMTQFSLSGEKVPHVADLLAAAAGKAQGEVSDMGYALAQGGLVAAQMGVSIEETTGTLAAFAAAGLKGSDAGTSLKSMLQKLANPSHATSVLMEELGITTYDAQGNFVGLAGVAGQLQEAFKGQRQETRDAAMATIFGSDAVRAASVLYKQGASGIQEWNDKVNDQGYAAETAAIKLDNLSGDVEAFKGSLETALIGAGEGSQGTLRGLVQGATDVVNAFSNLPGPIKSLGTGLLALTAITGGGLWFGVKAISSVASMRLALEGLTGSAVKANAAMGIMAKASVVLAAGFAANWAAHLGDANLSMSQYVENLRKTADTGEATAALDHLGFSVDSLGESLHRAAFLDNPFGMDWGTSDVKDMDEALSHMATGPASKAFEVIAREGKKAGLSTKDLTELFPQYVAAQKKAAAEAEKNASSSHSAARGVDDQKRAMKAAADAADKLIKRVDRLNGANLDARSTNRAYHESLDEIRRSMKANGRTLDVNTEKGRANAEALDGIARSANEHAKSMREDGRSVNKVNGFLQQSRKDLYAAARQFGMSKEAAHRYVNQVLKVPKKADTDVNFKDGKARTGIRDYVRYVNQQLHGGIKDEAVKITLSAQATRVHKELEQFKFAEGGPVRGPGTATSDSIPAMLSAGEHVWTAAEVKALGGQGNVELLRKAVLRGQIPDPQDLPGAGPRKFAKGGPVLSPSVAREGSIVAGAQAYFDQITRSISASMSAAASKAMQAAGATGGGRPLGPNGTLSAGQLVRGQRFAKAQDGKPYIWGGVGPTGYDCSGFQSAIINAAQGRNPYSRIGATGSMPWPGSRPGVGRYTIGWFKGNPGHTSGNIAGLGVESTGNHVRVGGAARSPMNGMFNGRMHYAKGGEVSAILKPNEYVINDSAVRKYGTNMMSDINAQRYHDGGLVRARATTPHSGTGTRSSVVKFPDNMRIDGKVTITNPATGEGYIRGIARSEVRGAVSQSETLNRQRVTR